MSEYGYVMIKLHKNRCWVGFGPWAMSVPNLVYFPILQMNKAER